MIFEPIRHPFSHSQQIDDGPEVKVPERIVFEGAQQALETGETASWSPAFYLPWRLS